MKKRYIAMIICCGLIISGCTSGSFFVVNFDMFSMKFYDNTIKYHEVQPRLTSVGIRIVKEYKEIISKTFTGFVNSLLVIKTPIQTGIDIQKLVESNMQNLTYRLLNYVSISTEKQKIKCYKKQYTGYVITFSYQLDNQTLYGGQYYFLDDNNMLYLISFHSEYEKDVQKFIKSIKTIKCL